ncbi:MAG TPA: AbrB/MazE/SpoVT family DNA-binding domain-containing protein [Candidatus Binataceae bacterium]|nr:AbrB/MazE/SpoVT family DNA-binding domain-containing protein [Candidatus Binataceae bacterium]
MKLKIDRAGRIVVPKPLRERLGLKAGAELEVVDRPERILLRMPERQSPMTQVNGLWVRRGRPEPNAGWDRVID